MRQLSIANPPQPAATGRARASSWTAQVGMLGQSAEGTYCCSWVSKRTRAGSV
jgi:hypothetical protein